MGTYHTCRWSLVCIRIAKIYKCDTCHKNVQRITSLGSSNTAVDDVVGYHEACFRCISCKKLFGQRGSLQVHMRKHSDSKPYKCNICDREFITQAGLVIHKAGHKTREIKTKMHDGSDKCFNHIEEDETDCDDLENSDVFCEHSINKSSQNVRNDPDISKTRRNFNKRIEIKKQMDSDDRSVSNMNKLKHTENSKAVSHSKYKAELSCLGEVNSECHPNEYNPSTSSLEVSKARKSRKSIETSNRMVTEVNSVYCTRLKTKSKNKSSHPIVEGNRITTRLSFKKKEPVGTNINRNVNKYVSTRIKKPKSNDKVRRSKVKRATYSRKKESIIEHVPKTNKKLPIKSDFESLGKKLFQCDICKKICSDSSKLNDHLRLHSGEKPFVCKVCNKGFRIKACLKVHTRVHTGEMPFRCGTCSKGFKYRQTFRTHAATHQSDPDKQIKCDHCNKQFLTREGLLDHSKKAKKCDECSEVLCSNTAWNIHKLSNHTIDTFSVVDMDVRYCQLCNKTFKLKYTFLHHMQKHARRGIPVKFPCSSCSEYFDSHDLLRDHRKTHSMKRDKCVKCPLPHCGRMLTSQTRLNLHLKRHNGETQYLCHRCGMRFTDCVFYLKHRKACYQKITTLDCPMCGKVLSGYTALHRHVLAHKGEKPCQCEVCGSRFNNTTHLKRHKRIHIRKGEMPPFDGENIPVESLHYSDSTQAQKYTESTEAVDMENEQVATYLIEQQNGTTYISTMEEVPVHLQTELLSATPSVAHELEDVDSL